MTLQKCLHSVSFILAIGSGCGHQVDGSSGTSAAAATSIDPGSVYDTLTSAMKSDSQFLPKVAATQQIGFQDYSTYFTGGLAGAAAGLQKLDSTFGTIGNYLAGNKVAASTISLDEIKRTLTMVEAFKSGGNMGAFTLADSATAIKTAVFLVHSKPTSLSLFWLPPTDEQRRMDDLRYQAQQAAQAAVDKAVLDEIKSYVGTCTSQGEGKPLKCDEEFKPQKIPVQPSPSASVLPMTYNVGELVGG